MPNNGIISRQAVIPDEFKVATTTEFNNETDVVILNKALTGSKVEQKAVTLNQLAGMIGGGEAGPQGPMGPAGPAGPQGIVGPQGPAGTATLPYSEFSTRFVMAGSSMPPSPSSFIIGSAINQFGLTNTNVGISQSAPGMLNITFPAGTFSLASAKNVLTISQDVDSSWSGNRLWTVKFIMQGFASTPTIFLQVFMWDGTAWVTNFTETVALRLTYRRYN